MEIRVSGVQEMQRMVAKIGQQMPFAMSVALNRTANAVQQAVRVGLSERFTLRRKTFIEQTIYRNKSTDFATKSKFTAIVRVNPERDVLAMHEPGGVKTPRDGKYLMLPTSNVRRTKRDLIADSMKPRALYGKKGVFKRGDVLLKSSGRGKSRKVRALYIFKKSARLPPRLGMLSTGERVVSSEWVTIASQAIDQAIRSAR